MPNKKKEDSTKPKRPRGRPEKLIPPIHGQFEDIIKSLVQPVKKRTSESQES